MEKESVEPAANAALKKEEAHTPGPWKYVRDCDYWEIRPTQIGGKDNYEGNEADYRLAAAAPEMFAVLLDAIERSERVHSPVSYRDDEQQVLFDRAKAIISKLLLQAERSDAAPTPLSE